MLICWTVLFIIGEIKLLSNLFTGYRENSAKRAYSHTFNNKVIHTWKLPDLIITVHYFDDFSKFY